MEVKHTKIELIKHKMNILLVLLVNLSVSINGISCSGKQSAGKNDPLPSLRPEKLVIEYHLDGGMRYYSEALYLSEDSSYYTVNNGGAISRVNFKLSTSELDELYNVFKDNKFDRIRIFEEKVYDRGGNTIFLRWGKGKMAAVSNSGMSFVEEGWREQWNACIKAIEDIITKQKELLKKSGK